MGGAHRSTTASRAASARKSAAWLLQLAALVTVLLALVGLACLVGYLIVANPAAPGWLLPVGIVLLSAAWIWVLGDIAWFLRRERRRSAAFWVRIVGRVLPLVAGTILMPMSRWAGERGLERGRPHDHGHGPAAGQAKARSGTSAMRPRQRCPAAARFCRIAQPVSVA